jgi:hypothetical protein
MTLSTRTWAAVALALLCLLTAGKCDTNQSPPGHTPEHGHPAVQPTPNNAPHKQPVPGAPAEVQGPPVVNGDAGPQNDSHFVVYQLHFVSKRQAGGHVEYIDQNGHTVGPVQIPANSKVVAGSGKGFAGSWEHIERAAGLGAAMGFTWFPIPTDSWAICSMIYNGEPVDYQIVQGGPCATSYTLPDQLPTPRNPGPRR